MLEVKPDNLRGNIIFGKIPPLFGVVGVGVTLVGVGVFTPCVGVAGVAGSTVNCGGLRLGSWVVGGVGMVNGGIAAAGGGGWYRLVRVAGGVGVDLAEAGGVVFGLLSRASTKLSSSSSEPSPSPSESEERPPSST